MKRKEDIMGLFLTMVCAVVTGLWLYDLLDAKR